jgi:Tol biopolymer transport system component
VLAWIFRPSLPASRLSGFRQLTHDGRGKIPPLLTDGTRLYFTVATHAGWRLAQVSARGGEVSVLSVPASLSWSRDDGPALDAKSPHSWLTDISPDGTELLAISWSASDDARRPIWIVSTMGSSARRLGDVSAAGGAAWSPDGRAIACADGHDLRIARSDGTDTRTLATVTGNVRWPRWSPDGSRIRFMVDENGSSIWEVRSDGSGLKMIFAGWTKPPGEMPLAWTPDGAYFLFSARHDGARGIWAIREKGAMLRKVGRDPILLTKGSVDAWGATLSKDGRRLFVLAGAQQRGELMRYDRLRRRFVPYLRGISAEQVSYSRDGRWLAYVTFPENELWRCRIDGAACQQLTMMPFNVFGPRWSPDGKTIAFSGHEPNKPWNIYLVPADGGPTEHVFPENRAQCDPDWSPDGRFLVFGDPMPSTANRSLELLDLESRRLATVPGSKGLFSPRWSPDGRHIVAVTMDIMEFRLFDIARRKWRALVSEYGVVAWPCWSHDGSAVYFLRGFGGGIYRVDAASRKVTQVADSGGMRLKGRFDSFFGITSDDTPLILRDATAAEIHVCDWQTP